MSGCSIRLSALLATPSWLILWQLWTILRFFIIFPPWSWGRQRRSTWSTSPSTPHRPRPARPPGCPSSPSGWCPSSLEMSGCTFPAFEFAVVIVIFNQCSVDFRDEITHIIEWYDGLLGKLDKGTLLFCNCGKSSNVVRWESAVQTIVTGMPPTLTNHSIWWICRINGLYSFNSSSPNSPTPCS